MKKKPLTLAAYRRGDGTKPERAAMARELDRTMHRAGQDVRVIDHAALLLAQTTGEPLAPDDDLPSLVERVRADTRVALVLDVMHDVQDARRSERAGQDAQRERQTSNARKPRALVRDGLDASPEAVRAFAAEWIAKHGNERGVQTACAHHFGLDARTVAARLRR